MTTPFRPPRPSHLLSLVLPACLFIQGGQAQGLTDFSIFRSQSHPSISPMGPGFFPGMAHPGMDASGALLEPGGMFEAVNESLYVVGPGDAIMVGMGNKMAMLPVNPEGNVVIETVGPVAVADKTLLEAKKIIIAYASKVFRGDKIYATLGRAKKIQVSIVGAVVTPGVHEVSATARLTEGMILAGGLSLAANRKVTVFTRRGDTLRYDLDLYFRMNDMTQNPYLTAGDQVKAEEVDYHGAIIEIWEKDQVSLMQLKENQSAYDLVSSYFRVRPVRHWDFIHVYAGRKLKSTLSKREATAYMPAGGEALELHSYKPLVFVTGAVARPAAFEFNVSYNALDYISTAGVQPISGNYNRLQVIGADGVTRWVDSSKDKITPGDHIVVPQSSESRMRDWIGVLASVAGIVASITLTVVTLSR